MGSGLPLLTEDLGDVVVLTINRPSRRNAFDQELALAVARAVNDAASDPAKGAVILRGAEGTFSAGADMIELEGVTTEEGWRRLLMTHRAMFDALCSRRIATIAEVRGYAVAGGLEIVLSCDLAFGDTTAILGDLHINHALIPGGGATHLLPRVVGARRAKELLLLGETWDAETSHRNGILTRVVEPGELEGLTVTVAHKLANASRSAVSAVSRLVDHAHERSPAEGRNAEIDASTRRFSDGHLRRGIEAFLQRGLVDGSPSADGHRTSTISTT